MLTLNRFSPCFLVALLFLLSGCRQPAHSQIVPDDAPPPQRVEASPLETDRNIRESRQTAITRAVDVATPAVVSVNVIEIRQVQVRDPFAGDPFFEYFFGNDLGMRGLSAIGRCL